MGSRSFLGWLEYGFVTSFIDDKVYAVLSPLGGSGFDVAGGGEDEGGLMVNAIRDKSAYLRSFSSLLRCGSCPAVAKN
jgi:hypothetical protein